MKKLLIVALVAGALCTSGLEAWRRKNYETACTDGNCGGCKGKRCKTCPTCPRRTCGRNGCGTVCKSGTCGSETLKPDYLEDVRSAELGEQE